MKPSNQAQRPSNTALDYIDFVSNRSPAMKQVAQFECSGQSNFRMVAATRGQFAAHLDNVSDHRAGKIDLQAEKSTRKSGFACIALLSGDRFVFSQVY